ncbi:MAG: Gfo/Idh/MocA family oxidoreductase [bacterium]|nr:Gfo/Idh/MocA family oxidoreductase [bacterium]
MSVKKLKVALIGCGRISYKHVEAINNNKNKLKLVAACDLINKRAQEKGVPVFEDYRDVLKEDIDIVTIATDSGSHAKIALAALNEGKHVIVEKPMALSSDDADKMIKAATNNKVKLSISHQNRFNPTVQKLREAVEKKRFGKLIAGNARILWNRGKNYYEQASWRGTYAQDGGCLMNQCIHNIDLLQWMMGSKVEKVNAMIGNFTHSYIEAEDYGSLQLRFKNGAIGNIEGTVSVYATNLKETLMIMGEDGIVELGGQAVNEILTWRFKDNRDSLEEVQLAANQSIDNVYGFGHTLLYKDMIEAIEEGREPYINGESGKIAMKIILDAYEVCL